MVVRPLNKRQFDKKTTHQNSIKQATIQQNCQFNKINLNKRQFDKCDNSISDNWRNGTIQQATNWTNAIIPQTTI